MRLLKTALALMSVAFACAAPAAAQSTGGQRPFGVWAADSLTKIDREGRLLVAETIEGYSAKNEVWDGSAGEIGIEAAQNEFVAFQLIVEGGEEGLSGVSVKASDLVSASGSVPADAFSFYREYYTKVTEPSKSPGWSMGPGWYADGLVPFDLPGIDKFKVEPGQVQGIWVDVFVAADAPAGIYEGLLTVTAGKREPVVLKLRLEVWDFALPAESHLRFRFGYNEALASAHEVPFDRRTGFLSQEFLDLELDFYRMCRLHRITPTTHYTTPIPDHSGSGAELTIDWESYDRRFGRYLDGTAFDDGIPVNIFSLPVNPQSYGGWPSSTRPGTRRPYFDNVESPLTRYKVDLDSFRKALELTVKHWEEKGWNLENAFVYVADEPDPDRYETIKQHCEIVKEVDERVHRCVAFYTFFGSRGRQIVADFKAHVNHWTIAADYMDRTALDGLRERGDWVGIYQGSEPFNGGEALDMDGVAMATWPWMAWMYDLDTLFLYMGTEWRGGIWDNPRNHGWVTNSQGVLIYPGLKFGVKRTLPTIRLKQVRRGMQDYEYMWLLSQAGRKEEADAIVRGIIRAAFQDASSGNFGDKYYAPGKWEHKGGEWLKARRAMAKAIVEGKSPRQ